MTLRSIADGVITVDSQGKIILLNRVAEALTGKTNDEAVGQALGAVYETTDPRSGKPDQDITKRAVETGAIVELERPTSLRSKDGKNRLVAQSAAPRAPVSSGRSGTTVSTPSFSRTADTTHSLSATPPTTAVFPSTRVPPRRPSTVLDPSPLHRPWATASMGKPSCCR